MRTTSVEADELSLNRAALRLLWRHVLVRARMLLLLRRVLRRVLLVRRGLLLRLLLWRLLRRVLLVVWAGIRRLGGVRALVRRVSMAAGRRGAARVGLGGWSRVWRAAAGAAAAAARSHAVRERAVRLRLGRRRRLRAEAGRRRMRVAAAGMRGSTTIRPAAGGAPPTIRILLRLSREQGGGGSE